MSEDNDMIRMVVKVSRDAQPELYEELSQRTPKNRAERFRTLAAMALMGRSVQSAEPQSVGPAQAEKPKASGKGAAAKDGDTEDEELKNRRRNFMKDVTF